MLSFIRYHQPPTCFSTSMGSQARGFRPLLIYYAHIHDRCDPMPARMFRCFQESTADFQSVTIQGQLTYRVADPKRLASLLDFSVDTRRAYYSDDPRKLPERLIHTLQTLTRAITQRLVLKDALVSSDSIVAEAQTELRKSEAVSTLGVEILSLSILGIQPTPETGRALEAEAREALQRRADERFMPAQCRSRAGTAHQGERVNTEMQSKRRNGRFVRRKWPGDSS